MNMADLVTDFVAWMEALPPLWAYIIVFLIAYGENVVPPIPGDLIVVFGGYLAGRGQVDLAIVIVLSTVGGSLGFMSMYAIGHRLGKAVLDPDRLTWLPQDQIDKAQRWLQRWGYGVVAANRFLSGARSVISLTVGMARMSPWKTAGYATLSAAVWTALIAYAGYAVGENWQQVVHYLRVYGRVIGTVLVLLALLLIGRLIWQRRGHGQSAESRAPKEGGAPQATEDMEELRKKEGDA